MTGTIDQWRAGAPQLDGDVGGGQGAGTMPPPLAGQFTMILPGSTNNPATEPAGDGYLLVTLDRGQGPDQEQGLLWRWGEGQAVEAGGGTGWPVAVLCAAI